MNEDGSFCAVRNRDGTPCTCPVDVQMNGGCIFYRPPKEARP